MSIGTWIMEKIVVAKIKPLYDKLEGKKTYVVLGVAILFACIDTWNGICGEIIQASWCRDLNVPPYIFGILAALGIYTRSVAKPK